MQSLKSGLLSINESIEIHPIGMTVVLLITFKVEIRFFAVTPRAPTIRGLTQVDEGTNLTLTCVYPNVATIPGNKTYTWTGGSNPPSPSSSNIYTQNMALDDAGNYTCNIQIDGHTSPDSAAFNVKGNL